VERKKDRKQIEEKRKKEKRETKEEPAVTIQKRSS
jgi:hypothetical protein